MHVTPEQMALTRQALGTNPENPSEQNDNEERKQDEVLSSQTVDAEQDRVLQQAERDRDANTQNNEDDPPQKDKSDKAMEKMQKRIDKLVARSHQQDELLAKYQNTDKSKTDEFEEKRASIQQDRSDLVEEKSEIQWKKDEARIDGDKKAFSKLVRDEATVDTMLKRLDDKYWDLDRSKKTRESEAKGQKNLDVWNDSWDGLMRSFPELMNDDEGLDQNSLLFKEAIRLMETNAVKPKFATFTNMINPKFDNANGPELAVILAYRNLTRSNKTKENRTTDKLSLSQNFKSQSLTGGSSNNSVSRGIDRGDDVDSLISKIDPNSNKANRNRQAMNALNAIKRKEARRS